MKKMDQFKGIFATQTYHIAGITEFKAKHGTIPPKELLEIDGYDSFINPDYEDPDTRGTIIYCKQYLNAQQVISDKNKNFKDCVWIKIPMVNNDNLLVGCIYRSGSKDKANLNDDNMHNMIRNMSQEKGCKCVLIMGDFNHPSINWTPDPVITTVHRNENHPEYMFVKTINDSLLNQHVTQATRDREGQQSKIDDLIFTSDKDMLSNLEHIGHLGESDHQILSFDIHNTFKKYKQKTITRYKYHQTNLEDFKKHISCNWVQELAEKSADQAYNIFLDKYNEACEQFVPRQTIKSNNGYLKPIWMKKATINLIRRKRSAHIKYLNTKARLDNYAYKSLRNQVTSATRQDRIAFERNISKEIKNNNKLFWRYVNSQRTSNSNIPDLKREDGTLTSNDAEKAELLNKQFTSVYTEEDINNIPVSEPLPILSNLDHFEVQQHEVKKMLKALRTQKSCGPDKVHPYLLKNLSEEMSIPLTIIFNISLSTGEVPRIWKEGIVTALFKKGNKALPSNYRPITLTSVVCKLLEKLITQKIHQHLIANNLENKYQHGFTPKKSTVTNLIEALNIWTEALSHGLPVDIIYLDFQKAFDTVPHERLLNQLQRYGISGNVHSWIKSYLNQRTQKVRVNGQFSSSSKVLSGVPQGSVLGPVLFLIFISDMTPLIQNFVSIYADDTKLFSYLLDNQTASTVQEDLNMLAEWSQKMQMSFNPDKCHRMHMGLSNKQYKYFLPKIYSTVEKSNSISYTFYFHQLQEVQQEKDLGVVVDNKLKFKTHISQKISKANSMLYLIKNCFKYLDEKMFLLLYKSLVRPHLEYASTAWSPITKEDIIRIEGVQRRATKLIPGLSTLSYSERMIKLELPSLYYRRLRQDIIFIYNYVNQNIRINTNTHCSICHNNQDMLTPITAGTRGHPFRYRIQRHHTTRRQFITSRVLKHWNSLDTNTATACSINIFKRRLGLDSSMPSCYTYVDYGAAN